MTSEFDGQPNKEMKQTRSAMAKMARPSLLISVFDRLRPIGQTMDERAA